MAEAAPVSQTQDVTPAPALVPESEPIVHAAPATPSPPKPDWPEDWRVKLSGGDEKALKQLERYASPVDIWNKARSLEKKLSSGEMRSSLPEHATPDQVAAWRKENGIPERPDEYDLSGVNITEEQKQFADWAKSVAHELNIHPSQLKGFLQKRTELLEQQKAKKLEESALIRQRTEDELRSEWGDEYRRNINLVDGLIDATAGDNDLKNDLRDAMRINPSIARWLVNLSRIHNPTATVVRSEGQSFANALSDEIIGLEKLMRDRQSDYWKGPNAERNQARLRELYGAREELNKRAA